MNFGTLGKVEDGQTYLDNCFRNGQAAAARAKGTKKGTRDKSRIEKIKLIEETRVVAVHASMLGVLSAVLRAFPSIDSLPDFYKELVKTTLDYYALKKALATINWGRKKVGEFYSQYLPKLRNARDFEQLEKFRREFFGRVSSVFYQIDPALKYLDYARKTMKEFPTIKTETKTVALVGFPNVGKTTLLFKLTGSKPEIANYAFTTKRINVSYYKDDKERIQVLDTPGSLNRFDKMNMIEKQAFLAMKYCSDIFVCVVDLTEPYPLKDQLKLMLMAAKFKKPTIIYLSKTDIIPHDTIESFRKLHPKIKTIITDIDSLKAEIHEHVLLIPSTSEPEQMQ
jgi:nucleolar GTP-binding protein